VTFPVQVLVLAKEPVAGRVKTRLCPPLTPEGSAAVAEAALLDTLDVVRAVGVHRRVLVLDGSYAADGFTVQTQADGPMDARLAAAYDDADPSLPTLLIGMDTPQLTADLLSCAVAALLGHRAVLGLAPDGGWWRRPAAATRPGPAVPAPTSRRRGPGPAPHDARAGRRRRS